MNSHDNVPEAPTDLILGDPDNPLVEISRFAPNKSTSYRELHLSNEAKINLSALMQHAANLATTVPEVHRKYFKVVFSPQVQRQLDSGKYQLVSRGGELLRR